MTLPPEIQAENEAARERAAKREREDAKRARSKLPFASKKNGKSDRNFWHVEPTGDYDKDFELGKEYGAEALIYIIRRECDRAFLGRIVIDMIANAQQAPANGIILGFMEAIQRQAEFGQEIDRMLEYYKAVRVFRQEDEPDTIGLGRGDMRPSKHLVGWTDELRARLDDRRKKGGEQ